MSGIRSSHERGVRWQAGACGEGYAPQWSGAGFAYVVARGKRVRGDPFVWTNIDNRLYLNYCAEIKAEWDQNHPGFGSEANRHWNQRRKD